MGDQPVIPFDQLTVDDVEVAGGKGANLGELTQAGLPVPPGFVITAAAYLEAMERGRRARRASVRRRPHRYERRAPRRGESPSTCTTSCARPASPTSYDGRSSTLITARRRRRRRAVVGHRRGHRRYVVRRDEPDVHQRARRRRS